MHNIRSSFCRNLILQLIIHSAVSYISSEFKLGREGSIMFLSSPLKAISKEMVTLGCVWLVTLLLVSPNIIPNNAHQIQTKEKNGHSNEIYKLLEKN